MLDTVKKRTKNDFSANRPYSLTITILTVSENDFLHFDRDFYIYISQVQHRTAIPSTGVA